MRPTRVDLAHTHKRSRAMAPTPLASAQIRERGATRRDADRLAPAARAATLARGGAHGASSYREGALSAMSDSYCLSLNGRFLLQSITGVQRVAREALKALDEMAHAGEIKPFRVLLPEKGEIVAPPSLKATELRREGRYAGHAWEQVDLPRLSGPEPLLCLGNTAPLARLRQSGRPTVTMVHDLSYKYFPSAYSWKFRAFYETLIPQVLRHSDHVVTVSKAEETSIRKHYPFLEETGRLSFLQNGGVEDAEAAAALAAPAPSMEERGYGLYVGSLTKRKNAEGVLRGAVDFVRRHPAMRFVVIGANSASFQGVTIDIPAEVADRIEFRGQINDAKLIHDAYRKARFLLFPSFYEASPLPPIEAMTFGCPVVSSTIPSLKERCGDAAAYCEADDQDSIAAAIGSIMDDPSAWRALSEASRAQAARYSWRAQAQGLLELCERAR